MAATLVTFGPMLKDFYQGPVAESINQRVWAREYFSKRTKGWNGRQMIIPVHTGRNTGVGFRAEGGILPVAGDQAYVDLTVQNRNSYGRFEVSGESMDTAMRGGAGAFAGVMESEMNRLVQDVSNAENHATIFGGEVKGFLNERKAGVTSVGVQNAAGGNFSAPEAWQYQGDFSYFDGDATGTAVTAAVVNWVKVRLFRMDTYAEILPPGGNPNIMVQLFTDDRVDPTLTLVVGSDAGGAEIDSSTFPGGTAIAVVIADARAVDAVPLPFGQDPIGAANPTGNIWPQLIADQPAGIFTNLASPAHFGEDRTTATGAALLQSTILTHDPAGPGGVLPGDRGNGASDLTLERIQYLFDTLLQDAGADPNLMIMNALMRHRYTVQLTGTLGAAGANRSNLTVDASKGKVMDNQQNLAYGGVMFQYDRHFPICTIGFVSTDPWLFAELTTGQFADDDGNVLSRTPNTDAWEGFWKHRYNLVCRRPNSQALLVGITPT